MKKLIPLLGLVLAVGILAQSCKTNKPPKSTGHKSFKSSRQNR